MIREKLAEMRIGYAAVLFGIVTLVLVGQYLSARAGMGASDVAAWIQAIGSVLAVGGAAYLPRWHENNRRREEKNETYEKLTHDILSVNFQINEIIAIHMKRRDSILPDIYFYFGDHIEKIFSLGSSAYRLTVSIKSNVGIINKAVARKNSLLRPELPIDQQFIDGLRSIQMRLSAYLAGLEASRTDANCLLRPEAPSPPAPVAASGLPRGQGAIGSTG